MARGKTSARRLADAEARVVEEGGRYYVVSEGRVRCGSCGHAEFRAVKTASRLHLFCAKCGSEHVDDLPPRWRAFLEEG